MKKLISLILMLALALLPAAALAGTGNANLGRDMNEKYGDSIMGAFVVGDTLYVNGYSNLYTYRIGDAELTPMEMPRLEPGENESPNPDRVFTDGERIYALVAVYDTSENYTLKRAELRELLIEGDAVKYGDPLEIDITELTTNYGDESDYLIQINSVCCAGGYAFMSVYDDMGQAKIYALDMATGTGSFLEDLENAFSCTPWKDGQVLIESFDYSSRTCSLQIYDPVSESLTPACDPFESDGVLTGLAYSPESGRLFYLSNGYIMAAEDLDFENAQPVAEFSTAYYNEAPASLLPGDYYVYATYDVVCVRSTNPEELPETRITVGNSGYSSTVTDAYYAFSNTHSDVAVILSSDYIEASKVIENMMNRDSSIDIYVTGVQSQAYDALYQRGYMAELESDALRQAVDAMYPGIRDVLLRDGQVVALPVSLYGWIPGVSIEGFEKIGISEEEIPTNWPDFLDFLEELPDRLPEDGKVRIFDDYMTQGQARESLLGAILQAYHNYLSATGRDPSYDTPELRTLMEKVMNLDYEALGLKEDPEDEADGTTAGYAVYSIGVAPGERTYTLIELNTGCTLGNFYSDAEPWLLAIAPGEQAQIPLDMTVAFVNPFSEHFDLAQEFMETILENLDTGMRYNVSDALNEPVRSSYYERNVAEMQKQIDDVQAALEKAEPVDKPMYEENIAELERALEDMAKWSWDISPDTLEWYRAHAGNLSVMRYNAISDAEGVYDLAQQLLDGRVDVATFLKNVDQKVRMMALEGN